VAQSLIVFDLEFTAWPGSMDRNWKGPGEHREVVQFGAVAVSASSLEETGQLDLLVKPRINPVLSDYFIELTGITNEEVARRGLDFPDAMRRFLAFCDGRPLLCFGRDDLVLIENVQLYGLESEFAVPGIFNVRSWMKSIGMETRGLHSCDAARFVGVPHEARDHNAVEDARSVAKAIRALVERGTRWPELGL
jgi:inhibitor of KinA sporulation pathway (predicted exonuclease)